MFLPSNLSDGKKTDLSLRVAISGSGSGGVGDEWEDGVGVWDGGGVGDGGGVATGVVVGVGVDVVVSVENRKCFISVKESKCSHFLW